MKSWIEIGTYPQDDYDCIEVEVEYRKTRYIPERMYLSNGDIGWPAEGGEVEDIKITRIDTGEDITDKVSEKDFNRIEQECYDDFDKYEDD